MCSGLLVGVDLMNGGSLGALCFDSVTGLSAMAAADNGEGVSLGWILLRLMPLRHAIRASTSSASQLPPSGVLLFPSFASRSSYKYFLSIKVRVVIPGRYMLLPTWHDVGSEAQCKGSDSTYNYCMGGSQRSCSELSGPGIPGMLYPLDDASQATLRADLIERVATLLAVDQNKDEKVHEHSNDTGAPDSS